MKLLEFLQRHDDARPMEIRLKGGTLIRALFDQLLEEDYFSFFVRAEEGCSPHVEAGQLLEILGVDVLSIDGQEFETDPDDPGPGPEDL